MSRILVVDDVATLAEQYAYDLKRIGAHEVATVTGGSAALKHLEAGDTDCVILDLEMPGMDGFAVLRALRSKGDETPVIVYTGTGNFERCIEAVIQLPLSRRSSHSDRWRGRMGLPDGGTRGSPPVPVARNARHGDGPRQRQGRGRHPAH